MSRITKLGIKITIDDIPILRSTCERLGFLVVDGPVQYAWHGGQRECDIRIDVPGVKYQVGLIADNSRNYSIEFDNYGGLGTKVGHNAEILLQEFGADKLDYHAQMNGWAVTREEVNNEIHVTLQR